MPETLPTDNIKSAENAVEFAQEVRQAHARRTRKNSTQRKRDINLALKMLKEAMSPLRSEIGRFPYGPQTDAADRNREKVYAASDAIQRERRKLWKMLPH